MYDENQLLSTKTNIESPHGFPHLGNPITLICPTQESKSRSPFDSQTVDFLFWGIIRKPLAKAR